MFALISLAIKELAPSKYIRLAITERFSTSSSCPVHQKPAAQLAGGVGVSVGGRGDGDGTGVGEGVGEGEIVGFGVGLGAGEGVKPGSSSPSHATTIKLPANNTKITNTK